MNFLSKYLDGEKENVCELDKEQIKKDIYY